MNNLVVEERISPRKSHIIITNTLYNYVAQAWLFLLSLAATPYILAKLGEEAYGLLSIIGVVVGWFSFLDVGLGRATIKYVSECYARKDYATVERIIGTSLIVYFGIGALGAALLAASTNILVTKVLNISSDSVNVAALALYLSTLGFLINMPLNVFGTIPKALQRFDLLNRANLVIGTSQTIFTILLLYGGFHLLAIVVLNVIMSILGSLIYMTISKKLLPTLSLKPVFDYNLFRKLLGFTGYEASSRALFIASSQINKFFIGVFLPISLLTFYTIPYGLINRISGILVTITSAIFPAFSEFDSLNQRQSLLELYFRATRYVMAGMLFLMPFVIIYSYDLLRFWISPDFAAKGGIVMQFLAFGGLMSSTGWTSTALAQGLNRPDLPAKAGLIQAFMNAILCLILIPTWGIAGAGLAWAIHNTVVTPIFIHAVNRTIRVSSIELFIGSFAKPLLVAAIISMLGLFMKPFVTNIMSLIIVMILCSLIYILLAWLLVLDSKDKEVIMSYAATMVRKKSRTQKIREVEAEDVLLDVKGQK